jgi:hypothetical protein
LQYFVENKIKFIKNSFFKWSGDNFGVRIYVSNSSNAKLCPADAKYNKNRASHSPAICSNTAKIKSTSYRNISRLQLKMKDKFSSSFQFAKSATGVFTENNSGYQKGDNPEYFR